MICPRCKGVKTENRGVYGGVPCNKCNGRGQLDWIEAILGKSNTYPFNVINEVKVKDIFYAEIKDVNIGSSIYRARGKQNGNPVKPVEVNVKYCNFTTFIDFVNNVVLIEDKVYKKERVNV